MERCGFKTSAHITSIKHESLQSNSAKVDQGLIAFNHSVFTADSLCVILCHFSCYLGRLSRTQTDKYLLGRKPGTYLIRDSSSIPGDFVLAVRYLTKNQLYCFYVILKMILNSDRKGIFER